jgi:hypothetical protein
MAAVIRLFGGDRHASPVGCAVHAVHRHACLAQEFGVSRHVARGRPEQAQSRHERRLCAV